MQTARFAHHSLRAFPLIRECLVRGDAVANKLPRGYGRLKDQLQHALLGAYLPFIEGAAREGEDRRSRLRTSRAEAGEAAGALEAALALGLVLAAEPEHIIGLLDSFCAMVTGLGQRSRP